MNPQTQTSLLVGIVLALIQATVTVVVLKWAWKKKSFYSIWAAGTFARFLVFGFTAFVVYRFTKLNLAVTLISLALATMVFMIVEVKFLLTPKK